jgi:hypothetical protein
MSKLKDQRQGFQRGLELMGCKSYILAIANPDFVHIAPLVMIRLRWPGWNMSSGPLPLFQKFFRYNKFEKKSLDS